MPLFDYKCPECGVVDERYVSDRHASVRCENCRVNVAPHEGQGYHAPLMAKVKFGGRSVFNINGYNAHNSYGLRWADHPHDIKMRGLT